MGHEQNEVVLTRRQDDSGGLQFTPFVLDGAQTEFSETKELHAERASSCNNETWAGIATWRTISARQVVITTPDGEPLPEGIIGADPDRSKAQAWVICEEEGNAFAFCGH